jgi:hypothetical protein
MGIKPRMLDIAKKHFLLFLKSCKMYGLCTIELILHSLQKSSLNFIFINQ